MLVMFCGFPRCGGWRVTHCRHSSNYDQAVHSDLRGLNVLQEIEKLLCSSTTFSLFPTASPVPVRESNRVAKGLDTLLLEIRWSCMSSEVKSTTCRPVKSLAPSMVDISGPRALQSSPDSVLS